MISVLKKNYSNFMFSLLLLQLCLLSGCSISYGITKENMVYCKQIYTKFGVILNNSENISINEIDTAEQMFLTHISSFHDNDFNFAKKKYENLHRQYCKKTINGNIILYINYLCLSHEDIEDFIKSDEPYKIFAEPDTDVINNECYVNLTQKKIVYDIKEHNNLMKIFWNY